MHHAFLDQYCDLTSPIHSWNARFKAITCLVIVICIVSLPPNRFVALSSFIAMLLATWYASGVPSSHLLKRLAILLPFVLLMSASLILTKYRSYDEAALISLLFILGRAVAAIIALTLLTSTTPFPTLLTALQGLRVPSIILALLSFMYRFTYILVDEFERLNIGRKSREFGNNIALAWRSRAWMLGTFLIRSMERSERVYQAMAARGYDGEMKCFLAHDKPLKRELYISIFVVITLILIRIGVTR